MKQYQPLYLKYRPQKLSELAGQEVVTKTLSNAISYNKIVHAYLFCGPRGTGKTSTARILAKSLNCCRDTACCVPTIEPCGQCVSCQGITNGNSLDVIEIDAASHRKVEDAEDLINRVSLGTYGSRFKIYIIDEVHMLTDHAFNALLKTLEEPPKNVIFILATTEEYKVIPTIISRCQKLDFKPIVQEELEKRVREIALKEKINVDETIIKFIAKRSNGCLRDAISLLDQISVLQTENKSISPDEVFELFGTVNRTSLFKLMESVLSFNRKMSVDLAEDLIKSGKDISELFKDLLELIIDLAKAKIDSEYRNKLKLELSSDLMILDKVSQIHLLKIIDRLHDTQSKLRFALSQELQFMADIMSMLDEDFLVSMAKLKERIEKLEKGKHEEQTPHIITRKDEILTKQSQEPEDTNGATDKNLPSDLDVLWQQIVTLIESNPTKTLLTQSESYLLQLTEELVEVGLSKDMFLPRLDQDAKKKEMILKAVKLASGLDTKLIKFKVVPKQIKSRQQITSHRSQTTNHEPRSTDDFTNAVSELLGARQIE
ncbi:MAG: DNA polymerase III, subunit gamma and tau [Candidatus Melainabacteria bacterium RIFCSPLOWO2_02_FULL_35_15]|nr:MAG: DNA polymerase III, subunit gamma and tau [Candidatus Melainabacteria bacterium RIFCSPLOWO2_12_FULL_35_11]OGI13590.1 MAG: DNA polymerase III, subunit gamma and tau [Candidatus Melainabacteria bacterium RIFCSPLOWO2_02_FULL_35_15]